MTMDEFLILINKLEHKNKSFDVLEVNCNEKYYYLIFLMLQYINSHYNNNKTFTDKLKIIDIYNSNFGLNIDFIGGDEFINKIIKYSIDFSKTI